MHGSLTLTKRGENGSEHTHDQAAGKIVIVLYVLIGAQIPDFDA